MKSFVRMAAVVVLFSPLVAFAIPILVSGEDVNAKLEEFNNDEIVPLDDGDWLISFVEGSYTDLAPTLHEQIWWDQVSQTRADTSMFVARAFAELVGYVPDVDNAFGLGPIFAVEYSPEYFGFAAWSDGSRFPIGASPFSGSTDPQLVRVFAVAEFVSVPEPGTLGLFGIGLAGIGLVRRSKARW